VAVWFCFGTTHFCETCHNAYSQVRMMLLLLLRRSVAAPDDRLHNAYSQCQAAESAETLPKCDGKTCFSLANAAGPVSSAGTQGSLPAACVWIP